MLSDQQRYAALHPKRAAPAANVESQEFLDILFAYAGTAGLAFFVNLSLTGVGQTITTNVFTNALRLG